MEISKIKLRKIEEIDVEVQEAKATQPRFESANDLLEDLLDEKDDEQG